MAHYFIDDQWNLIKGPMSVEEISKVAKEYQDQYFPGQKRQVVNSAARTSEPEESKLGIKSVPASPSVVSEATAEKELVASSESAAVAFDTTT